MRPTVNPESKLRRVKGIRAPGLVFVYECFKIVRAPLMSRRGVYPLLLAIVLRRSKSCIYTVSSLLARPNFITLSFLSSLKHLLVVSNVRPR